MIFRKLAESFYKFEIYYVKKYKRVFVASQFWELERLWKKLWWKLQKIYDWEKFWSRQTITVNLCYTTADCPWIKLRISSVNLTIFKIKKTDILNLNMSLLSSHGSDRWNGKRINDGDPSFTRSWLPRRKYNFGQSAYGWMWSSRNEKKFQIFPNLKKKT